MKQISPLIISIILFTDLLSSQTISVDPDSIYQYLMPGESATQQLTINNTGDDTLYYSNQLGDIIGTWSIAGDWNCDGGPDFTVDFTFNDDGTFSYPDEYGQPNYAGTWGNESGTVELSAGVCDAVTFEFNAWVIFDYYLTTFYIMHDGEEGFGVIDSGGDGSKDGDLSVTRVSVSTNEFTIDALHYDENSLEILGEASDNISEFSWVTVYGLLNREEKLIEYRVYEVAADELETLVATATDTFVTVTANPNPNQRSTVTRDSRDIMIVIDPDTGMVAPGDSAVISISMSASSDDPGGLYHSRIYLYNNGLIDSLLIIPITIEIPDIIPPNPPENLTATPEFEYISLMWDIVLDDLHKYNIYIGTSISTITLIDSIIGDPPASNYQGSDVMQEQLYYYQVSAVDQAGNESVLSDTVSAIIAVDLVINEIMQNPSVVADANGEWFEIYNKGNVEVPLQNWTIKDADNAIYTITGGSIPIGSYFVFGNNSNTSVNGGVTIDYNYGTEISLSNVTDELILLSPNNVLKDSVAWDNGATFPDPTGSSMALLDPNLDNSLGSNWVESTLMYGEGDYGTPGLPNYFSDINLDLTALDFDTVDVNDSGVLSLTISNQGNIPLQLDSIYSNSTLFTLSFADSLIETSAVLQVTFAPIELGIVTDVLHIVSNDPDESMVEIQLSGFGYYPTPDIELESIYLYFDDVMDGLTGVELFSVYNVGELSLEIDTIYCSGGHDGINDGTTNFTVAPESGNIDADGTLELEVTFSPDDEAGFEGTLTIVAANDPDEDTLMVNLYGTGIAPGPDIAVSPDPLHFGIEIVPGDTIMKQLTIYNTGLLTLEIEEVDITNSDANNLFWTDFEDAIIEPGDSVLANFYFFGTGEFYTTSTASIINNATTVEVILSAGLFAYIESDTMQIQTEDVFDILLSNSESIFQINSTILFDPDLITINGYNLTERFPGGIIWEEPPNGSFIDNEGGSVYIVAWDLGSGIDAGNGPIIQLDVENNATTDVTTTLVFNSLNCFGMNANPIYAGAPRLDGIITIVSPPPDSPTGLTAEFEDGILLTWDENSENDFSHYILDKDTDDSFQTGQYPSITTAETSYIDTVYEDGQVLYYRLSAVDSAGNVSNVSETLSFEVVLNVNEENLIPDVFALHQNYPNPFNPTTQIRYDLPEDAMVSITIYDLMGRSIKSLVNSQQSAGYRSIQWNATNNLGEPVSAGMYIYMIQAGEFRQTKKMVLLK
jgi:hypothetical protein